MKCERPLIAAGVFLTIGLSLIFGYGVGESTLSGAYPLAGSAIHLDIMTKGPAALGGAVSLLAGLVLLLWALVAAVVGQIVDVFGRRREVEVVAPREKLFE